MTYDAVYSASRPGPIRQGMKLLRSVLIIALAVSITNSCRYCINSHTAAVKKLGLDNEGLGEMLAVVAMFNTTNKLAEAYQVQPDVFPS